MKKIILKISGLAAILLLLQAPVFSQEKKEEENEKSKVEKAGDGEEIIIRQKGDKDAKVTIEIKGGQVYINGKPVDEFEDDALSVRKIKGFEDGIIAFAPRSPFRGGWSYNGNDMLETSPRAFLGVSSTKASAGGAEVKEVTGGSAAEKIGLKKGDIITRIDEIAIGGPDDLVKAIRKYKPEAKVVVTYKRDGKEQKATAVLGKTSMTMLGMDHFKMPNMNNEDFELTVPPMPPGRLYGPRAFSFSYDGPRLGIRAQDTEDGKGAKVLDVDEDSPAEKAGIKEGDIITQLDGKNVGSASELAELARANKTKSSYKVKLNRGGKLQEVDVKIPKKLKTADL